MIREPRGPRLPARGREDYVRQNAIVGLLKAKFRILARMTGPCSVLHCPWYKRTINEVSVLQLYLKWISIKELFETRLWPGYLKIKSVYFSMAKTS